MAKKPIKSVGYAMSTYLVLFFLGYFAVNSGTLTGAATYGAEGFNALECDIGDLATTCYLNHTYRPMQGETINATNFIILSNGSISNTSTIDDRGVAFNLNITGNLTIFSGGSIFGGNVTISADNLTIHPGASINTTKRGYSGVYKGSGNGPGGGSSVCQPKWNCTEWLECTPDNLRYRECVDLKNCSRFGLAVSASKPDEQDFCVYEPTCTDNLMNGDETDVDCGGSCGPCLLGDICALNTDCVSMNCFKGICLEGDFECAGNDYCENEGLCDGGVCEEKPIFGGAVKLRPGTSKLLTTLMLILSFGVLMYYSMRGNPKCKK